MRCAHASRRASLIAHWWLLLVKTDQVGALSRWSVTNTRAFLYAGLGRGPAKKHGH